MLTNYYLLPTTYAVLSLTYYYYYYCYYLHPVLLTTYYQPQTQQSQERRYLHCSCTYLGNQQSGEGVVHGGNEYLVYVGRELNSYCDC